VTTQPLATGPRAALQTAADILISPNAAYARLREAPTWVIATLISVVLVAIAALLVTPALLHAAGSAATLAQLAHNPGIAKLPPDQQAESIARIVGIQKAALGYAWLLSPVFVLLIALVQTVVMLIVNAIARGDANFHRLWALAVNVQIAGSIGAIANASIVAARGANSFERATDIQTALPNLALLAPGAPESVTAALAALNPSLIWQSILLALGLIAVARIGRVPAWVTVAVMALTLVAFAVFPTIAQRAS
jgi:Yip1 domain